MTVSSTGNSVQYSGAGTTGPFSFPYKFLNDSDLKVTLVDSDGVETVQTLTTHYTVSGAGNASGGSVTTVSAVGSTYKIRIERDPPVTQTLDLVAGDSFPVDSVEREFDKSRMISQRHRQLLNRAVTTRYGEAGFELPSIADRAGKLLAFDSAGAPTASTALADILAAPGYATAAAASATAAAASAAAAAVDEAAIDTKTATLLAAIADYGNGWRPNPQIVPSGDSRYMYITWSGGTGAQPDEGYVTANTTLSPDAGDAVDLSVAVGTDLDALAIASAHGSMTTGEIAVVSRFINGLKSYGIYDKITDILAFDTTQDLYWKALTSATTQGSGPVYGYNGATFDGGGSNYIEGPNLLDQGQLLTDPALNDASSWDEVASWVIAAGDASIATPTASNEFFYETLDPSAAGLAPGDTIEFTFRCTIESGELSPRVVTVGDTNGTATGTGEVYTGGDPVIYTQTLTISSGHTGSVTGLRVGLVADGSFSGTVNWIKVKKVKDGNYTRKSGFVAYWEETNVASNGDTIWCEHLDGDFINLNSRNGSDELTGGINQEATAATLASITDGTGWHLMYRSGTDAKVDKNGEFIKNIPSTATNVPDRVFRIAEDRATTVRIVMWGSALTETERGYLYQLVQDYRNRLTAIGSQGAQGAPGDGFWTVNEYGGSPAATGAENRTAIIAMEADVGFVTFGRGTYTIDGGDFDIEVPLQVPPGTLLTLEADNIVRVTNSIVAAEGQQIFAGDGKWRLEGQSFIHAGWFGYHPDNGKNVNEANWNKFLTSNRFDNNFKTIQLMNGTYKHNAPFFHPQDTMIMGVWGTASTTIEMYGEDTHMHIACWVDHSNGEITWDNNGALSLRGTPQDIGAINVYWDGKDNMTFSSTSKKRAMAYMSGVSGAYFYYSKWRGPIGDNQMDGMLLVPERPAVEKVISSDNTWSDELFISKYRTGTDRVIHVDIDDLTSTGSTVTIQVKVGSGGSWEDYTDPDGDIGASGLCVFTTDQDWLSLNDGDDTETDDRWYRVGIHTSDYSSGDIRVLLANFDEDVRGASFTTIRECQFANGRRNLVLGRSDAVFSDAWPDSGGYGDMHGGKVFETLAERNTFKFASTVESVIYAGVLFNYWDESAGHTSKGEPGPYLNHIINNRMVLGEGVAEIDFTGKVEILADSTAMVCEGAELETWVKPFITAGVPVSLVMTNQGNPEKNVRIVSVTDDENCVINSADTHDSNRTMASPGTGKKLKRNTGAAIEYNCDGKGNEILGNYIESGFHDSILLGANSKYIFIERNYLPDTETRMIRWLNASGISAHKATIREHRPIDIYYQPANTLEDDATKPTTQSYGND